MPGEFLLDTNIVIALFDREQSVLDRIVRADQIVVSVVVLGELYYGAHKSGRAIENIARINAILSGFTIAVCDELIAAQFGLIKQRLRTIGRPLPDNDVWVAATSRQLGVTLASRDRHFANIENLSWDIW
jgi:tRNA(fMet)-specific endonuclease VapC